jgi:hypothetical protein
VRAGLCCAERVNVPDDGLSRQRVLLVLDNGLAETLGSGVYVGKEGGVVPVERVEVAGKLRSAKGI